jgi:uncharacterized membrane protein YvbJ
MENSMVSMKNVCEFDFPEEPEDTYACKKCGRVVTHDEAEGYKRMNAVLLCEKKEDN